MQKFVLSIIFMGLLVSCELFESKEDKTQKLVNEELLAIDWNDVDQYPLFEDCDETAPKVEEKTSVLNEISDFNSKISESLNDLTTVAPALKRGNPVSLRFRLPLVLNTN